MNRSVPALLMAALLSLPAFAQYPAGTSGDDKGSVSSPSGNPTPQTEVPTRPRHDDGDRQPDGVETEDGRRTNTESGEHTQPDHSDEHSGPGGIHDPGSDPGELE